MPVLPRHTQQRGEDRPRDEREWGYPVFHCGGHRPSQATMAITASMNSSA
nr:hypothetical protein [Acidithiobacillus ferridurans]